MNKKVLYFTYSIVVMSILFTIGIFIKVNIDKTSKTASADKEMPMIVYLLNKQNEKLDAEVINIPIKKNIYKSIVESLISTSSAYVNKDFKLKSVKKIDNYIKVKFSSSFKESLSYNEEIFYLYNMSIANTLLELKDIEYVEIYSGDEKVNVKNIDRFKKDTSIIAMKEFNSPKNLVEYQMNLEKKGDFLKSYLLMDHLSKERKTYYEYLAEMKEIESIGFLNGEFKVLNETIKDNTAVVEVEFRNVKKDGSYLNTSVVNVNCIKTNNTWWVSWTN